MFDELISDIWQLFSSNRPPARRRSGRSGLAAAECLEIRQMLTPAIVAPTTVSLIQDTSTGFNGANSISVSDTSGATEDYSIVAQHGTLTFGSTTGLTVHGNGTGTVLVHGKIAALNNALAALTYAPASGFTGQDAITMYVQNSNNNLSGSASIATAVNSGTVPPTLFAPAAVSVTEGSIVGFSGASSFGVADTDGAIETYSAVAQHGTFSIQPLAEYPLKATVSGEGTGTIILVGNKQDINQAMSQLLYTPNPNFTGQDSVGMVVQNATNHFVSSKAVNVTVTAASTPPVIAAPTTVSVVQDGGVAFLAGNSIGVTDLNGATEQISIVVLHGVLNVGSTDGVTVSGNGTGTLFLSGNVDLVNNNLRSLVYTPNVGFSGTDTLGMTAFNVGNGLATSAMIALTTTSNNSPPVLYLAASAGGTRVNVPRTFNGTFTTIDNTKGIDYFSIVATHGTLTLDPTDGLTVYGSGTGTLVITGSPLALNKAMITYTPDHDFIGTDTLTVALVNSSNNLSTSAAFSMSILPNVP